MSLAHQPLTSTTYTSTKARAWALIAAVIAILAAALLVALPMRMAGWLVLGGLVVIAVVLRPGLALYMLPFAVAFGSLISLDVSHFHAGPTDVLVGALALAWLLRLVVALLGLRVPFLCAAPLTQPGNRASLRALLWQPLRRIWATDRTRAFLFVGLLAYLAVVILSVSVAISKTDALKEVLKWSEVASLVALTLWLLPGAQRVRKLAWAMIAACVAEALLGYAQWVVASGDLGPGGASIRVFGTFAQPNPYAGYLNLALPVALALALFSRDVRERWVAGAASAILLGAEVLADSRGAYIGLAAALVTLVVVGWRRERLTLIAGAIGVPIALIAWFAHIIPAHLENTLLRQVRLNDVSVNGAVNNANFSTMERLEHWLAGLHMFAAHPILGVGAGNYNAAYATYAPNLQDWPEPLGHAHNYYINAAAETGIVGLIAFLALVVAMLYLGWRASHPAPRHFETTLARTSVPYVPTRALAIGFLAVIVALTLHNATDDLFVHAMELQLALCLACLLRLKDAPQDAA